MSFGTSAIWMASLTGLTAGLPIQAKESDESTVRGAIVAYSSNIASFHYYKCQFRFTIGKAANGQEGMAGHLTDVESYVAKYIVDGDSEAFEHDSTPQPKLKSISVPKGKKGTLVAVPMKGFIGHKYIKSQAGSARYAEGIDSINLRQSDSGDDGFDFATPLDLGCLGHGGRFGPDQCLVNTSQFVVTFLGKKPGGRGSHVGVRFDEPSTGLKREFWLDPERGYLPVRCEITNNSKYRDIVHIAEAKEVKPGCWFPTRVVSLLGCSLDDADNSVSLVHEMRVLELDVQNRPKREEISCVFPAGTHVLIVGETGSFRFKRQETVTADGLAELFEKVHESRSHRRFDTGLSQQQRTERWWPVPLAGVSLACLLGVALWWRRKHRREGTRLAVGEG